MLITNRLPTFSSLLVRGTSIELTDLHLGELGRFIPFPLAMPIQNDAIGCLSEQAYVHTSKSTHSWVAFDTHG